MVKIDFYKDFSEKEFINDEYFQNWVLKPGSEGANSFWNNFIESYPEKKVKVEKAKAALKEIPFGKELFEEDLSDEKIITSFQRLSNILGLKGNEIKNSPVIYFSRKWWMAAASMIILLGVGIYFNFFIDKQQPVEIATSLLNDVPAPKGNKAIITLSDGRQVSIDSLASGQLAINNNILITKNSKGEIIYSGKDNLGLMAYNTLYNPRGSKVQTITLADGTRVWLNAASTLRYPVTFSGTDRSVELNGEGYFEVAHNVQKPFHVSVNDMDVKVLGTHFNVNAYDDETEIKTSLLEGSVAISRGSKSLMIKPGEQAVVAGLKNSNQQQIFIRTIDTDDVIAWKNGFFAFRHSDLNEIIKQVSRWYDVEVDSKGNIKKQEFTGKIDRSLGLSDVLKILERTGVRFKIEEGRRMTILN